MNPSRITTTVGLNIGKIDVDGVRLNFWDLGGQQELQSLWDKVSKEFLNDNNVEKHFTYLVNYWNLLKFKVPLMLMPVCNVNYYTNKPSF